MLNRKSIVLIAAVFAATWPMPGNAVEQKLVVPKQQDRQALRADQVRQLLSLIDTGTSGHVSKQEWTKLMAAEFDRLDKDRSGMLDIKAVARSPLRSRRFADMGK